MPKRTIDESKLPIGRLIDLFLCSQKHRIAESSFKSKARYLNSFRKHMAGELVADLTASQVYDWIDKCYGRFSAASRHNSATAVKRLVNWALDERLISQSPIPGFRKPSKSHRESYITPAQYALCLRVCRPRMKPVIKFFWHTGCRPQEFRAIESAWIEGSKITFPKAKSKGNHKRRVIYLKDSAFRIATHFAAVNPRGPIFRNEYGDPWTSNVLGAAFRALKKKTGIPGFCAYSFRHGYITKLLESGVDVATVATLAGNSPRMVLEVYQHVAQNEARLLAQLTK